MAKIAFILLCHKDPDAIVAQALRLTAAGDCVAIHFDARAPKAAFERIHAGTLHDPGVALVTPRVRCGWGEWSLVRATLNACATALEAFPDATHLYMLSGDCGPVKSALYIHEFLDARACDYIESFDFYESGWIKTGMRAERLTFRHFVNERKRKWLFYQSLEWQKRLGLARRVPPELQMMIGSQWWCLRRATVAAILDFCAARRDILRFFATTWIPDETFFQTMVRHLVPRAEIESRTLTFLLFTDYGMPATFYNDHEAMLLGQDAFFARKISPEARRLKARLGEVYNSDRRDFPISGEGRRLHAFLTGRGRVGARFAPRIWEAGAEIAADQTLMIVACKKWHVGKRLAARIREATEIPALDYLFDEDNAALPDLGGIEANQEKRTRHRRATVRLLLEHFGTGRLVFCVDPARADLIEDVARSHGAVRILDLVCATDDEWLHGHALRTGLASDATPGETLAQLLPAVRHSVAQESARLASVEGASAVRLREGDGPALAADAVRRFLDVTDEVARRIAEPGGLFDD